MGCRQEGVGFMGKLVLGGVGGRAGGGDQVQHPDGMMDAFTGRF